MHNDANDWCGLPEIFIASWLPETRVSYLICGVRLIRRVTHTGPHVTKNRNAQTRCGIKDHFCHQQAMQSHAAWFKMVEPSASPLPPSVMDACVHSYTWRAFRGLRPCRAAEVMVAEKPRRNGGGRVVTSPAVLSRICRTGTGITDRFSLLGM